MHVEGDAIINAEQCLNLGGGRWEGLIRRCRRENDEADVARLEAGGVERVAAGFDRQGGGGLAVGSDVAAADAGSLDNPFVGRFDLLRQFRIIDAAGR